VVRRERRYRRTSCGRHSPFIVKQPRDAGERRPRIGDPDRKSVRNSCDTGSAGNIFKTPPALRETMSRGIGQNTFATRISAP